MIYRLRVPGTIEDTPEVRVLEWHGAPGDRIVAGALVLELETQKALIEVRATQAAFLRAIVAPDGAWCALGADLALLSDSADEPLTSDEAREDWITDFQIG